MRMRGERSGGNFKRFSSGDERVNQGKNTQLNPNEA